MTDRRAQERRALVVGAIIVVAGVIGASDPLYEYAQQVIVWAESLTLRFPLLGMLVFVLLSMGSAMMAFFSAVVLVPIAIRAWGMGTCIALLWVGWVAGGAAAYAIGFFFGRVAAVRLVGESTVARWEDRLTHRTRFFQVLLAVILIPSEIPGYVLGVLRYRFSWFMSAIAIGYVPHVLAAALLGDSFLKGRSLVFILIGGSVLLGALIYRQTRRRHLQRGRSHS